MAFPLPARDSLIFMHSSIVKSDVLSIHEIGEGHHGYRGGHHGLGEAGEGHRNGGHNVN